MLTEKDLRRLSHPRAGGPVVSVYLSVEPGAGTWPQHWQSIRKSALEHLSPAMAGAATESLVRLDRLVWDRQRDLRRGLIAFSGDGLWETYDVQVNLPQLFTVGSGPTVTPALSLLRAQGPLALALVQRGRARIFRACLGEIEEFTAFGSQVPAAHRGGGWRAYLESRLDRHRQEKVTLHLCEAASWLEQLAAEGEETPRVVLGGTASAVSELQSLLSPALSRQVAGTIAAGLDDAPQALLEKALLVVARSRELEERALLEELVTAQRKGETAALGLEDVAQAAATGGVHQLVVQAGLAAVGSACRECGMLLTRPVAGACPYCGGELLAESHLVERIARSVLASGGEAVVVEAVPVPGWPGIGAWLRRR